MKEFKGKVAVVTGAGSGIGRAMAGRFAAEGMKVVLADVQPDALERAESELKAGGAEILAVPTDVSKGEQIETLAEKTLKAFGGVHILCNNAGVAAAGTTWERSVADWEWVFGVNMWGVIHGIRVFTPLMLKQDEPCHIVNTASLAGLISGPGMSIYSVTKHAVVTLSEAVFHELKAIKAKIGISVLCPGWVKTGIMESERNRPGDLKNAPGGAQKPGDQMLEKMVRQLVKEGQTPEKVAGDVLSAIVNEKFYILTHPEFKELIRIRMEDILQDRQPTYRAMV